MNTINTNFEVAVKSYLEKLQHHSDTDMQANYPNIWGMGNAPKFQGSQGKKWYRINKVAPGENSAFCFIDPATGDIYKPAGYNKPATGARGNIYSETPPLTAGAMYRYK